MDKLILLVDDDPAVLAILKESLRPHYQIRIATNGRKALELAHLRRVRQKAPFAGPTHLFRPHPDQPILLRRRNSRGDPGWLGQGWWWAVPTLHFSDHRQLTTDDFSEQRS